MPSLHHEHDSYKWWVLANIMIGTFIAVLDSTIVNVGLPKITASLGTTVDNAEWILTAYLLVFGVMLPASGWVADHFGYKRTYFFSLLLFTLGSFMCGFSSNLTMLLISRVIQGMGAGFIMPVGMAIVMREFPIEQRGLAMGFWAISAAASVSFGPIIGGYLIDKVDWQAIFDVNVPIGVFGMFATLVIQREYKSEQVRSFDVVGFLSMAVFLVSLLLALAEGNAAWNTGGWSSPFILMCFFISAIGLVVFLVTETLVEHPFVELGLLKDFNFAATNAILFIFGLGMFGSTFLLPLYLQNSLGYTAFQSGLFFLPVGIVQGFSAPIAGLIGDKFSPKIPAVTGIILLAISLYMNSFLSLYSEHAQIIVSLYIRGLAMGLLFTPLSILALANIPRHKIAQASGMFNVIRQIGGSFGVAMFGAILTKRVIYHATVYGQAIDQTSPAFQHVMGNVRMFVHQGSGLTFADTGSAAGSILGAHLAQQAFVKGVCDDFFIAAAISAVAFIPVIFLKTNKAPGVKPPAAME
jgi:DHA2 family multidrug resistance protein